jgi:hypothetical protein
VCRIMYWIPLLIALGLWIQEALTYEEGDRVVGEIEPLLAGA